MCARNVSSYSAFSYELSKPAESETFSGNKAKALDFNLPDETTLIRVNGNNKTTT